MLSPRQHSNIIISSWPVSESIAEEGVERLSESGVRGDSCKIRSSGHKHGCYTYDPPAAVAAWTRSSMDERGAHEDSPLPANYWQLMSASRGKAQGVASSRLPVLHRVALYQ